MSSGYSSSGYLIVSTCDMIKVLENLMFGHLPKKSTNCQRKRFGVRFHLYLHTEPYFIVSSEYSSSGYLIVSICDRRKVIENLKFNICDFFLNHC